MKKDQPLYGKNFSSNMILRALPTVYTVAEIISAPVAAEVDCAVCSTGLTTRA